MGVKAKLPPLQVFEKPRSTRRYGNPTLYRIHLDLSAEEKALVIQLTQRMQAGSMVNGFRRLLPVWEQIVCAIEEGKRPVIIDDELNELETIDL